jgi:hypothetical protein
VRLETRLRARIVPVALAASLLFALAPSPTRADDDRPLVPRVPESRTQPPPGYRLSARDALTLAERARAAERELERAGSLTAQVYLFGERGWQVRLLRDAREVVRVDVDDRDARVSGVWTGPLIDWPLARGEHGPRARRLHVLMLVSALLFLAPFVKPRRLWRAEHLDLLALLAFGVAYWFHARGRLHAAVPLVYLPLLYLLVRFGHAALRGPSGEGSGERLTWLSPRALGIALLALLAARYAYDLIDGTVNDVGYGSVLGADSIQQGYQLYDASPSSSHADTYGPVTYLLYVPFELLFPLKGLAHAHAGAARAAAIVFDLATVSALAALGRRLRPGPAGRELGFALGWAFAACPWSLYVLAHNANDGLVAMLLALSLLLAASPLGRGLLVGLAGAAKFAPVVLGALFLRAGREHGRRSALVYLAAAVIPAAVLVAALLPDGGLGEFWDATIGFQLTRDSPFSIWGLHPGWEPLQPVATAAAGLLALAALWLPRERSVPQLAAAGTALLAAVQIGARHWFYFYVVWLLPYALVALFSRSYATSVRNSGSSPDSATVSNTS